MDGISKIQWNIRSQISEDNQAESTGVKVESSAVKWKIFEGSELNSVENGLSSSEEQDSEVESSSDEGEYEISDGTDETVESLGKTLEKTNLSDDNETDNNSDKNQRVLFSFGSLAPAEYSEELLEEGDLSDDSEIDSGSDEEQLVLPNLGRLRPAEYSEKSLNEVDLSDKNESRVRTDELPSRIVDKDFIFMPPEMEHFEEKDEWKTSGKWLVFNHGDLEKLDALWTGLRPLVETGTLVGLKCSTATDRVNGVTMCYTTNCEDKRKVKMTADAIREISNDGMIMYYKTNAATDSGYYRMYGDKFITKYMHSCAGSLYERDEHNRWKKIYFEEDVM